MDLELTEEQQLLQDMAGNLLAEESSVDHVREMEDDARGFTDSLWQKMGELGLAGLTIPAEHGGGGMTLLEAALLYEKFGYHMTPSPHFNSCIMSAGALAAAGSDAQKAEWLPKIASGAAIVTPAWIEPDRGYGEVGVRMPAVADGEDFVLNGQKRHVGYAGAADALLVLAWTDAGVDLFLVDAKSDGISMKHVLAQGRDAQYFVDFKEVRVPAANRIGAAGSGWRTWHKTMLDGIVLQAASAIGGATKALEITVEYAKIREQFDKPLGAFQALAHYMADCSTTIEGGRVLVQEAAWNASVGRSTERFAPMAKLFCAETYRETTRQCEQIWGGVGFTIEYDIQMYFRRAKQLQLSWWDPPYLEELIAADVLDG
jgi:alkylation response protein AidB-like acyl-CoA dehydrogenase